MCGCVCVCAVNASQDRLWTGGSGGNEKKIFFYKKGNRPTTYKVNKLADFKNGKTGGE